MSAWSPEERERLRELYQVQRLPLSEVAQVLGRSYDVVRSAVSRYRFGTRKFWTAEEVERLRNLYSNASNQDRS